VTEGRLGFTVRQMGAPVEGSFATWTATIDFDPEADPAAMGEVMVSIDMSSLTLGSVTRQAVGPEFFDVATHPTAVFSAAIRAEGAGYLAEGTLTLRGVEKPLALPFTLVVEGGRARMEGGVTLDRRDFRIGAAYPDEASLGFAVDVAVALTAQRN
jgi:polyisoprenoid-binding protein YceI